MKVNTRSRYGMRLLIDLANQVGQGPVTVGDISRRQSISLKYLEQLIHILKKEKLITSVRGARGGHLLAKPAGEISFGQVLRLMEIRTENDPSFCRKENCRLADHCPLNMAWKKALDAFYMELDAVTIEALSKECCK